MGADSQLSLYILTAASGALATLISKMCLGLGIQNTEEVGPVLLQAASCHWIVL